MSDTVLVLRVCHADMSSSRGFVWPAAGPVEAPDWSPVAECGHGLHGWLWGAGDISASDAHRRDGAKWLVVEVEADSLVDLAGKVKFPRGVVVFCGDANDAAALIATRAPAGTAIIRGTATAGYRGTATAGVGGIVAICWYDPRRDRYPVAVAEVGENGIEPATAYCVDVVDGRPRFLAVPK